jgi:hypothetical protein
MESRRQHTQRVAAARAGISERSARRIDRDPSRGGDRPERHWRTRGDPLAGVWETELVPLLEATPALKAVTLLEELEARHPDTDWRRHRRTLERRVRGWRAQHGPAQEVVFRQKHPPGRLGLSDFTVADDLGVTIAGVAFPHRLYHFTLAFSQWQHAEVITGGESYVALAEGLQNALWALGGAPELWSFLVYGVGRRWRTLAG